MKIRINRVRIDRVRPVFIYQNTGRVRLIQSHSSARFSFELSDN